MGGGAMYYLAKGLKQKWLGILFSVLVIPYAIVISAVVDTNSIGIENEVKGEFYAYDLKTNKKTSTHQALTTLINRLNTGTVTKEDFAQLEQLFAITGTPIPENLKGLHSKTERHTGVIAKEKMLEFVLQQCK